MEGIDTHVMRAGTQLNAEQREIMISHRVVTVMGRISLRKLGAL